MKTVAVSISQYHNYRGHYRIWADASLRILLEMGVVVYVIGDVADISALQSRFEGVHSIYYIEESRISSLTKSVLAIQNWITLNKCIKKNISPLPSFVFFPELKWFISPLRFRITWPIAKKFPHRLVGFYAHPINNGLSQYDTLFKKCLFIKDFYREEFFKFTDHILLNPSLEETGTRDISEWIRSVPDCYWDLSLDYSDPIVEEVHRERQERRLIVLVGCIEKRKNYDIFIEAASRMNSEKYLFVMAGKWDPGLSPPVKSSNLLVFDQVTSDRCLNTLLKIADVNFVTYKNHSYSSGILVKSAALGTPSIASKSYMGDVTKRHKLGIQLERTSVDEVVRAIHLLTANDRARYFDESSAMRFGEFHSERNWTKRIREVFEESL